VNEEGDEEDDGEEGVMGTACVAPKAGDWHGIEQLALRRGLEDCPICICPLV
jgi:hypothetical protein